MWQPFKVSGRMFEWRELPAYVPEWEGLSYLDVRSREGDVLLRALVHRSRWGGRYVGPVAVMGSEFPPGSVAVDPPFLLNGYESLRHGIVHTEFVRLILERSHRTQRYRRLPLTDVWRRHFSLSI